MKKWLLLQIFMMSGRMAFPSAVAWNEVTLNELDDGRYSMSWQYDAHWIGMVMLLDYSVTGQWSIMTKELICEHAGKMAIFEKGCCIGKTSVWNSDAMFTDVNMEKGICVCNKLSGVGADALYLAVLINSMRQNGEDLYGWINLEVTEQGTLVMKGSAIGLDGQDMIVGGGELIPEPTSGMLMLFGFGLLGLRRRRRGIV